MPFTQGNLEADNITQRIQLLKVCCLQEPREHGSLHLIDFSLQQKLSDLESACQKRKAGLNDSQNCLQFYWKADTVESWISKQAPENFFL